MELLLVVLALWVVASLLAAGLWMAFVQVSRRHGPALTRASLPLPPALDLTADSRVVPLRRTDSAA